MHEAQGWYDNSIKAWKADLHKRGIKMTARYERLLQQNHPCAEAQWALVDMNSKIIQLIDAERRDLQKSESARRQSE